MEVSTLQKIADGRTDLVFELAQQGFDLKSKDEHGVSLIRHCAYYGDVSAVRFLLSQGCSLSDLGENMDLNAAVFHRHWQLCHFLLEQGADARYIDEDSGEGLLHSALSKRTTTASYFIVQLLLRYGADPNHQTHPRKETGAFMRDVFTRQETPLHRAAAFADTATIQLLLDAGADKTIRDMNGDSPLSWASWYGRSDLIIDMLCFPPHRISALRVEIAKKSPEGTGALDYFQNGQLHF